MNERKQATNGEASAPEITLDEMDRLARLSPSNAVRMQQRALEHRQDAKRLDAAGDRIAAVRERADAAELEHDAALALDPVLHTTAPVTVGNGGEVAMGTQAMAPFKDTVRANPDMLVIEASRKRMALAKEAGALTLGLDAAATIEAGNSLEKMLMHQATAAHVAAMELQAEARDVLLAFKRTGYNHPNLSMEVARLTNASARMMETYQRALLTLERLRNGGKQTVVVQHVSVADGGQAVVAGQVKAAPKRRRVRGAGG